ncbi:hypothetical protein ACFLYQ_00830 [Chloroflexota bacterium]
MAGKNKPVEFRKNPLKYIIIKAGMPFWLSIGVFIVSLAIVVQLTGEEPPGTLPGEITLRFFDAVGTIALFLAYLSLGVTEEDYTR